MNQDVGEGGIQGEAEIRPSPAPMFTGPASTTCSAPKTAESAAAGVTEATPSPEGAHARRPSIVAPTTTSSTLTATNATPGHHLLNREGEDSSDAPPDRGGGVPGSLALRLYISHFLSTWNARVFEFGAALFLTSIFPGTLLPVSIYSLVRNAGYIIFAQPVGEWINRGNRLSLIRASIVGQRVPVAASCALLLVLLLKRDELPVGSGRNGGVFAVIVFLSVVEKLSATMNLISVERDWVGEPQQFGYGNFGRPCAYRR
jgi:hypothetical protein